MPADVRIQLGPALTERAAPAVPDAAARRLMVRAARAVLRHEKVTSAELSITLLDDAEIAQMNSEFLAHEGVTDVISFALYEADEDPVGDIYIGLDQAMRQAAANDVDPIEELARLTVHGTLHVLGHDHPDGPDRLESEMWRIQESIIARVLA